MVPLIGVQIVKTAVHNFEKLTKEKVQIEKFGLNYRMFEQHGYYYPIKPAKVFLNYVNHVMEPEPLIQYYQSLVKQTVILENISKFPSKPETLREAINNLMELAEIEVPSSELSIEITEKQFKLARKKNVFNVAEEGASDLYSIIYYFNFISLLTGQTIYPEQLETYTPDSGSAKRSRVLQLLLNSQEIDGKVKSNADICASYYPISALDLPVILDARYFGQFSPTRYQDNPMYTKMDLVSSVECCLECYIGTSMFSIEAVADSFGFSARKLQIDLKAQGTSFRKIKEKVILKSIQYLFIHTDHSLTEIAQMTSFATISQFSRAIKRITGVSPKHYREFLLKNQ